VSALRKRVNQVSTVNRDKVGALSAKENQLSPTQRLKLSSKTALTSTRTPRYSANLSVQPRINNCDQVALSQGITSKHNGFARTKTVNQPITKNVGAPTSTPHKARQVSTRATDFKGQTLDPTTDFESRRHFVKGSRDSPVNLCDGAKSIL
jgi:hypothetical protein